MATKVATALMFVGEQCGRAAEAVDLYAEALPGVTAGEPVRIGELDGTGDRDAIRVEFAIGDARFIALDGVGPHEFSFTPSVSIWADFDDAAGFEVALGALCDGWLVRMAPGDYGFSERFAWVDDRYGVSWQLNVPSVTGGA